MTGAQSPEVRIGDDSIVLRWLEDQHLPKLPGRTKPNSDLFKPSSDGSGCSVAIARSEQEVAETVALNPDRYWVRLTAEEVRSLNLDIEWQPDPDIPRHAGIVRWPDRKRDCVKLQRQLANSCDWHGDPPPFPPTYA